MLTQLIYTSQPFGYDSAVLGSILSTARRNNARDGITGALICRADVYLQLLEGPAVAIDALFARIVHDDRHLDIVTLSRGEVTTRMFPDWAMLHDPAVSWLWTVDEVAGGAIAKASPNVTRKVFEKLAH